MKRYLLMIAAFLATGISMAQAQDANPIATGWGNLLLVASVRRR
jgi:hypothetical protein